MPDVSYSIGGVRNEQQTEADRTRARMAQMMFEREMRDRAEAVARQNAQIGADLSREAMRNQATLADKDILARTESTRLLTDTQRDILAQTLAAQRDDRNFNSGQERDKLRLQTLTSQGYQDLANKAALGDPAAQKQLSEIDTYFTPAAPTGTPAVGTDGNPRVGPPNERKKDRPKIVGFASGGRISRDDPANPTPAPSAPAAPSAPGGAVGQTAPAGSMPAPSGVVGRTTELEELNALRARQKIAAGLIPTPEEKRDMDTVDLRQRSRDARITANQGMAGKLQERIGAGEFDIGGVDVVRNPIFNPLAYGGEDAPWWDPIGNIARGTAKIFDVKPGAVDEGVMRDTMKKLLPMGQQLNVMKQAVQNREMTPEDYEFAKQAIIQFLERERTSSNEPAIQRFRETFGL